MKPWALLSMWGFYHEFGNMMVFWWYFCWTLGALIVILCWLFSTTGKSDTSWWSFFNFDLLLFQHLLRPDIRHIRQHFIPIRFSSNSSNHFQVALYRQPLLHLSSLLLQPKRPRAALLIQHQKTPRLDPNRLVRGRSANPHQPNTSQRDQPPSRRQPHQSLSKREWFSISPLRFQWQLPSSIKPVWQKRKDQFQWARLISQKLSQSILRPCRPDRLFRRWPIFQVV